MRALTSNAPLLWDPVLSILLWTYPEVLKDEFWSIICESCMFLKTCFWVCIRELAIAIGGAGRKPLGVASM